MAATPGVARIRAAARASSERPPSGTILTSSPWSPHEARLALAAAVIMPSTASKVPTAKRDDQRGREAAPPAAADVAQADLRRARQEADAAQQPVAGVLAADRGAGRLERLAQRHPDGAPDRGQRRQRRREQPHQRAGQHDVPVDAEADADREEGRAEVAGQDVGEHDPEDDPDHRSQRAEQHRGLQVDRRDLPPAPADRLHDPDLRGLLGDQRRHRVRDQHQRRQQREEGDHVEELRELLEAGLAGPVARRPRLRQVGEAVEAGDRGKRAADRRDRRIDGGRAGVGQPEDQLVVAVDRRSATPPSPAWRTARSRRRR